MDSAFKCVNNGGQDGELLSTVESYRTTATIEYGGKIFSVPFRYSLCANEEDSMEAANKSLDEICYGDIECDEATEDEFDAFITRLEELQAANKFKELVSFK